MDDLLPEDQKTPLKQPRGDDHKPMQRIVHNPLLVSLRHVNGKRRHIHCISVDVLESRIGVTFRGPKQRERYFTEWFDRKFWHLITGDEKKAYYQKREEYRQLLSDKAYQKRVQEREAREARKLKRLGVTSGEDLQALYRRRHARRKEIGQEVAARKPRILFEEVPTPEHEPEPALPEETPAPVPEPVDPDALTQAEEQALAGPRRPFPDQRVGNLEQELPGEYNAMLHMKQEKHPFGDPDKLRIFDALVTGEAVKQEAMRKIAQRKRTLENRQAIERGECVWTSGD